MLNRLNNDYYMQYKHILTALLIAIAVVPSTAQQTAVSKATAVVKDTTSKKGYSHVPLAGEKSYFGEKNDYVNDFTRKYLELHYNTLGSVQNKSEEPFSVIDDELERKNMPKELKYLAVIESALNHN